MRKVFIAAGICAAILMWGCAHRDLTVPPVSVNLPNGMQGAVVYCKSKAQCFLLSTYMCKGGTYLVVQKDDKPVDDFVSLPQREDAEFIIQCTASR